MYFLALDQSTSASKALLFDCDGKILDREAKDHRQHYPQPGWVEHDADEIWANCLHVLRTLLERHRDKWEAIESLSISNQRETTLVWNRATGKPRHRAIVWQCRRSTGLCDAHFEAGNDALIQQKTGLRLDAYFSGSKLQWMVEHHEGLAASLASGETVVGTIDAYLIHRLTKGAVLATDHTNASRTLLFDIGQLRWDADLCALFKVPVSALPEVRESFAGFGATDLDGFFPRPLPIQGVMGDSQASLFAQRCFEPGAAKVTFGTGSSILLNIGADMRFSERGVVTTLAWVHDGIPTYAFEGIIISSASTLEWLKNQLGLIDDAKECEPLARELADNQGVYLVPAFAGLGLPHWKPNARAAIVGLSSQSDRRHIVRAALESIAYQIQDALEAMRADAGVELRRLHGDGGPTANTFLMQFVADLAAVELHVNTVAECSPLGAVLAGMLGRGHFPSMAEIAAAPRSDRVFSPLADAATVVKAYAGWEQAVAQVLVNQP